MKKGFIIFSGTNFRAAITLFRFFKSTGTPFFVIAMTDADPIFKTSYKRNVFYERKTKNLDTKELIPVFKKLKAKHSLSELIICPTSEYINHFLLDNRLIFEAENIKIPLVSKQTYNLITNKYSFAEFLKKYNVDIPNEFEFTKVRLPFVAKPSENIINGKVLYPQIIFTPTEYEKFTKEENPENYFYQEYIKGESYYLLYYFDNNHNFSKFSQKNLAQQPNGKSIVYAEAGRIHDTDISIPFEKALVDLEYSGWIMVEVIKKNDKYYFIEANPRFWGPLKLVLDQAPHLFERYYGDLLNTNIKFPAPNSKKQKYFWLGGMISHRKENLKWYMPPPQNYRSFLLTHITSDVYFNRDSFRYFLKEIFYKN